MLTILVFCTSSCAFPKYLSLSKDHTKLPGIQYSSPVMYMPTCLSISGPHDGMSARCLENSFILSLTISPTSSAADWISDPRWCIKTLTRLWLSPLDCSTFQEYRSFSRAQSASEQKSVKLNLTYIRKCDDIVDGISDVPDGGVLHHLVRYGEVVGVFYECPGDSKPTDTKER